jgi:hypothetical protein
MNKMRTYLYQLLVITAGVTGLASCHKALDLTPTNQVTDMQLWSNQGLVVSYANNFYAQLRSGFNSPIASNFLMASITDDAVVPSPSSPARTTFDNPSYTASNSPLNPVWASRYSYIRRANLYLAHIDGVPGDPQLNRRLKAEVRFLRAYYYYDLVCFFGGVPLITEAQNATDSVFLPRNSLSECYNWINGQLDSAAMDLPTTYPATDAGRVTKQAAWGLKCRVQMMNQDWVSAAATAKTIMNMGVNSLLPNYTAVFTTKNNAEMLLSVQHDDQSTELGTLFDKHTMSPYYGGEGNNCPTQNLVDDYQMQATGLAIAAAGSGYDPSNPYKGRDPRFAATVLFDSSVFKGRYMQLYTGGADITVNNLIGVVPDRITPTGYYLRKFSNEAYDPNGDPNARSSYNWPLIRYAEILLNYAESQNEAVGPDVDVYIAVNLVRRRSAMPAVPSGISQDSMRQVIRHERRIELAFEDFRYWDVKRWGLAESLFTNSTNPVRMATLKRDPGTGVVSYSYGTIAGYTRLFQTKHYLFPIPQSELNLPGNKMTQNPGW